MSDIDSDKWLEAMKSGMDSMGSNQVWTLVDPPKGARPVGCKWVYKRKFGADGEVMAFKARLVVKGYTQRPGIDFEETYSPVAMAKSIRILLAIAAWYDYEIWQMDVKTAFLNDFVEEEIFMDQPEGFTAVVEEHKVYLQRSIYGLKQASQSWNTHFDEVIRGYDFIKNDCDPCIYKKISGSSVAYLVLYVDDILLIGNDVKMLRDIKAWLSTQFSMKDMGEASYILGIKIYRDRSRRVLRLTQSSYIEKVLKRFKIEHSK
ncbi:UNVERIFIED_CONTAM: Retrovirus-related Pol polyprotein from transposon TNT 1-94 [Sesamum radiatum]|uniref:Retrovirus-related Pol polyprotein from transposon TNT 1-94 n=1 Tax=Sesamum radiatum TaxID=300843 RepID=A0AAW2T7F5_SESRA